MTLLCSSYYPHFEHVIQAGTFSGSTCEGIASMKVIKSKSGDEVIEVTTNLGDIHHLVRLKKAKLHVYLSTACFHEDHGYCKSTVTYRGDGKMPGQCKFCDATCTCDCHELSPIE